MSKKKALPIERGLGKNWGGVWPSKEKKGGMRGQKRRPRERSPNPTFPGGMSQLQGGGGAAKKRLSRGRGRKKTNKSKEGDLNYMNGGPFFRKLCSFQRRELAWGHRTMGKGKGNARSTL